MFSATFLYLIFATFVFALLVIYLLKSDIKAGVEFMDKFEMYGALFVICYLLFCCISTYFTYLFSS